MSTADLPAADPNFVNGHPAVQEGIRRVDAILSYARLRVGAFADLVVDGRFPQTPEAIEKLAACLFLAGLRADDLHALVRSRIIDRNGLEMLARSGTSKTFDKPLPDRG
jgi:hypothetical protein